MDNHPIPQDVTGFQFRLIGDMTIKQFAYLAVGVVLGWICFALPINFFLKAPLGLIFASAGVLLAFVPIGGRPADSMLLYFFKAVFSPSQYVYQKALGDTSQQVTFVPSTPEDKNEKKEEKKDDKKTVFLDSSPTPLSASVLQQSVTPSVQPQVVTPPVTQPILTPAPKAQEEKLTQEVQEVTHALEEAKKEETKEAAGTQEATVAHEKVATLEEDLQTILAQKQELEKQLQMLQQKLSQQNQQVFQPSAMQEQPKQTAHVLTVPASLGTKVGIPLGPDDVPNLIIGVVKEPRGNVLPNILIEVKDKDDNPVRAFKTNPLGQFASATPVLNGIYTITFEDPNGKHKFDSVEITANGGVVSPLEVTSVDEREELRKELFG